MRKQHNRSDIEELVDAFPRGIALLQLSNPEDVTTWKLAAVNDLACTLVTPSIDTFLSSSRLRLTPAVDLPNVYREIVQTRLSRTVGMIEAKGSRQPPSKRMYTMLAFPVGARGIGIVFDNANALLAASSARLEVERQLTQTCEFLGAVLWRADPATLQFTYVSPHAQAMLGYWLERWTGESNFWKKHLFPDDREHVAAICDKIHRERKRQDFEFRMISVRGQILWFHAAAELSELPGRRPELIGVMNDITDLKHAEERIRALSSRLMRLQDDERRHISRELHDSLGQYLTSIKINLEIVKRESPPVEERHRALLVESSETLERCVQEVRSVSYLLHPPLLDELGLLAALRWYTAGFSERSGIEVNLNTPTQFSRLSQELELALFRIVQESLTNIQRHSQATAVVISLSEHSDRAELRVDDNGIGIPEGVIESIKQGKAIEGVGLRGMYERVRELGGRLDIESSPRGTAVSGVLPLKVQNKAVPQEELEEELHKPRSAGKPLESSDVRIRTAGPADPSGKKQGDNIFTSSPPQRVRRASRRSR